MDKEELNKDIHDALMKSSELFLKKEHDKSTSIVEALDWVDDIVKNENLNQVSDIYIFEEGFGTTEVKLKNTLLHLITSVISFEYSEENMDYLEEVILSEEDKNSDIALDYLLKIGGYHSKFRDRILEFVDKNKIVFSKNKLNTTAFYLATIYDKNDATNRLFKAINELHTKKYPSQESSKDNKRSFLFDENIENKKPWWKFW